MLEILELQLLKHTMTQPKKFNVHNPTQAKILTSNDLTENTPTEFDPVLFQIKIYPR
jgi:hypothetical protein